MGKLIRNGIEYGGGNGTDIFKVTQAEYDALEQAGTLVHNALYVITDAPNLNGTADDIEYSSGVTVKQAVDSKQDKINGAYITSGLSPLTNVTIADGGYCKIGNLVVVNMRLVPSANITAGNTLVSGLPKPQTMSNLNKTAVANNQNANLTVDASGGLFCSTALTSGSSLILSVTYLTDTV